MASESSSHAASHNGGLSVNELKPLYEALYSVRTKYRYLGLQLGVELSTIQGIEADHKNVDDRLLEVLFARLNGEPPLTWGDVVKALRSRTVGSHHRLANSIHESYIRRSAGVNREISDKARRQETKINISSGERQPKMSKKCSEEVESSEKARIDVMHERSVKEESGDSESEEEYLTAHSEEYAHSQEEFSSKATNQPRTAKSESVRYSQQYKKEEMMNKGAPLKGKVSRGQSEIVVKKQCKVRHPDTSVEGAEASDEGEQDSDPEVSEKTTPHKPQLESEDESSSASTSGERSEVTSHDYVRKPKYNEKRPKVNPEAEKQESQKVKHASGGKISSMKEHLSILSSDKQSIRGKSAKKRKYMHNEDRSDLRDTKRPKIYSVTTESPPNRERIDMVRRKRKMKTKAKGQGKRKLIRSEFLQSQRVQEKCRYPKLSSQEEQIEEETLQKKATEIPLKQATQSSPSTKDSTEDEDWGSDDDRSEDEEDRDSEQTSSNEEEETEHDDGSSTASSKEEEVKKTSVKSGESNSTNNMVGITRKRKQRLRSKDKKGGNYEKKGKAKKREVFEVKYSSLKCVSLSESEKIIVSLFERFYGQLCCKISNPVETAAELQKKGLISKVVMKDMIRSPESQQVKTISLVDTLDEVINSQPDSLFMFIEVLLENDSLQRVGREMLREAGKVCPERTLARFPSQVPLSKTVASSSEVAGKPGDKIKKPAVTQATSSDGTSSSETVSQSVPQSGLSPVLTEYKRYLQSCYKARVLAPADKYLPTLETPYINLAMIRRGRYNLEERDEFTRRTLHGGVDQILENKSPIKIEDLLAFEGTEEPYQGRAKESMVPFMDTDYLLASEYSKVLGIRSSSRGTSENKKRVSRFILVEGPPGIGKSTFAWEACRRWDEIESLRDYHAVVLLKLREKWVLNAASLSDLLRYPSHPDFSNSIAKELVKLQGEKLLLVLDGFDEVSHSFHENSVIKSILCRQLLPECTIILTTRPVAKSTLESICQPIVDKHIEIIGFTEEERVRYITEVFSKEPELQVNFLKYMFLVPHIKSMMYIPLNCAIIAQVYYESQSSRHLAIPRTRTQLYKALTHSLLVRHMKMKESNCEYTSMLPEGLNKEDMDQFKILAKFAFDSYHKGRSRKVTFFKEDIPEGLVHFGFMNESTEMYAGKGVERTFSFLHLSLQEYLAAWHLANSYSIEFQVAYHRLAVEANKDFSYRRSNILFFKGNYEELSLYYKGDNQEEESLLSSLSQQSSSLEEPAIFLAGITGMRCQSEDDRNHWEMYLSHDTALVTDSSNVLLRSLYEAQNPTILPLYYYASNSRTRISIGLRDIFGDKDSKTPYDCYAVSFCLANSSDEHGFDLTFGFNRDNDISLVETFVQGLNDHCKSTTPRVNRLKIVQSSPDPLVDRGLLWLIKANLLNTDECHLPPTIVNSSFANQFLRTLPKLQSLKVFEDAFGISITSWEWLAAIQSLSKLKQLYITSSRKCSPPPPDIIVQRDNELSEVVLDVILPTNTIYDLHSPADVLVDSVLKYTLKSNQITKMVLPHISRETMAGVRSILLHCPSLTTLELKRTRLGYDGIIYICSALRHNRTLRHLVIHEDLQLPPFRKKIKLCEISSFSSMERVLLPSKTTCTDFLLELNDILKDNTTLEEMKIQSGLFLPLSTGENWEYCQWTGLGPLQQFNVGAVRSGMSPNLRRSFSSSDLTQPQTQLFWDREVKFYCLKEGQTEVDFKKLFSKRKEEGKKLCSLPSFTAPDTEVLQSFSGLDPRLKECLEISHLHKYVETLRWTYTIMLQNVADSLKRLDHLQQPSYLPSYLQQLEYLQQPSYPQQPSYLLQPAGLQQPLLQPTYLQPSHLQRHAYHHSYLQQATHAQQHTHVPSTAEYHQGEERLD